jgi:DNA topoisomerase-2
MAFNKKRAEDRKYWLENIYDRNSYLDTRQNSISYTDFVNKELIHFSKYDCERSIPNLIDGLKISTRKILYSAFKKNLNSSIKVAQFSGYVSEHSGYHHGEESLNKAIVGMAQNYVGSNNINLLTPEGQFGSRMHLGKDSASPRYIFTRLEKITRFIYPHDDDDILNYLDDDGTLVEPQFYVPIIPMILINGSSGIGTGFSSDILCYNPIDIITYLKNKLLGQDGLNQNFDFMPYYQGFTGTISKISANKILFKGVYIKTKNDEIIVTELPIGMSTQKFKELIDKLENDKDEEGKKITPVIKETKDNSTESNIHFTIIFPNGKLQELEGTEAEHGCNGLEKTLKLFTTETTSNMNLFNSNDKLVKYNTISDIIEDYYLTRLGHYQLRKNNLIDKLEKELKILRNKSRYIQELLNDVIDLRRKSEVQVNEMLETRGYEIIEDNYNYLTHMKMSSVCDENVTNLNNKYAEKEQELFNLRNTTIENMWLNELQKLEVGYDGYIRERNEELKETEQQQVKEKKQVKQKQQVKTKEQQVKIKNKQQAKTIEENKKNPIKNKNSKKNTEIKENTKVDDDELEFNDVIIESSSIKNTQIKIPTKTNSLMEMQEEEYIVESDDDM